MFPPESNFEKKSHRAFLSLYQIWHDEALLKECEENYKVEQSREQKLDETAKNIELLRNSLKDLEMPVLVTPRGLEIHGISLV